MSEDDQRFVPIYRLMIPMRVLCMADWMNHHGVAPDKVANSFSQTYPLYLMRVLLQMYRDYNLDLREVEAIEKRHFDQDSSAGWKYFYFQL